jgi:glycine/D-amino acid oxidase-like deaminating enzyme
LLEKGFAMAPGLYSKQAKHSAYDVVIVGGAMYGASVSWWLTDCAGFVGRILVVERDSSYEFTSTAHTNSCIRQQFSRPINIKVSQFGAEFIKNFRSFMGGDERVPDIKLQSYGYMYMADTEGLAATLKEALAVQQAEGAGTKFLSCDQIALDYPFYKLDDIVGANHNTLDEGYFDGGSIFDWWKRSGRERGVEYIENEVVSMTKNALGTVVESVTLRSGEVISCGTVVNASGPRAARTAAMAGISLPVEPRKRYTYVFDAEQPLDQDLPLTIDPCGVHMRTDGAYYLAGGAAAELCEEAVDYDDFEQDHSLWDSKFWPALANRIPQFEAIKLINSWAGHYAYNLLDQNAIVGRHTKVNNFIFVNGFSGHGFQQSPAIGRGTAELIAYGEYRSLDLSPFEYKRIEDNVAFTEKAVI